jgi:hypothetical protein
LLLDVAVAVYQRGLYSLAKAARLAGLNRLEFQKVLAERLWQGHRSDFFNSKRPFSCDRLCCRFLCKNLDRNKETQSCKGPNVLIHKYSFLLLRVIRH